MKDGHANDAAQDVVEDLLVACHRTWRRNWPSGPGRRAPSSPRHHRRRRRLCAARAEMGAQLGSSVAFCSPPEADRPLQKRLRPVLAICFWNRKILIWIQL